MSLTGEYFSFNGLDIRKALNDEGFSFIVNNTRGRGLLSRNVNLTTTPDVDGARILNTSYPVREIEVDYTLIVDNLLDLRDAESVLTSLLSHSEEKVLQFADQVGEYKAILSGNDVSVDLPHVQQGTLVFTCSDPYRYRLEKAVTNQAVNSATPLTVQNEGNSATKAKFEIKLQASTSELKMTVGSQQITYKGTLTSGTVVVFDSVKQECRVTDKVKILEVSGEFPVLMPKQNQITLNTASLLSINYRERDI